MCGRRIADGVASDAKMQVTDGYGTWLYPVSEAKKDASGNYIFTARIAAAQMTDTISLQLISPERGIPLIRKQLICTCSRMFWVG